MSLKSTMNVQNVNRRSFLTGCASAATAAAMGVIATPTASVARTRRPLASPAVARAPHRLKDVRTIRLTHQATGDRFRGVYSESGRYIPEVMEILNWTLRDVNVDEVRRMDPKLIDALSNLQNVFDLDELIVTSGYRCRATNERIRRRTGRAAKNSYHMHGMAADVYSYKVGPRRLARAAWTYGAGGVGYYPYNGFVHLDVGPQRRWRG
ncbi:MAG: DUF882 domain-containing protein [Neomegalonema sp.]|nr:DUF882 domain-containing protein [Neomegalonema sp.]